MRFSADDYARFYEPNAHVHEANCEWEVKQIKAATERVRAWKFEDTDEYKALLARYNAWRAFSALYWQEQREYEQAKAAIRKTVDIVAWYRAYSVMLNHYNAMIQETRAATQEASAAT